MRTCTSCGRENADDQDFCASCGEYLRWEPTGVMPAITPAPAPARDAAPPPPPAPPPAPAPPAPEAVPQAPRVTAPAPPPPLAPPPPHPAPAAPPRPAEPRADAAAPPEALAPAAAEAIPPSAAISLRLPDQEARRDEELLAEVEPGGRTRILAQVRNQSRIVDTFELRVEGLPAGWWSVFPDAVHLIPYGSGGTYEQEVEIHLHPPRSPEAHARRWELWVAARSRAHGEDAAQASFALSIRPYQDTATTVRPERAKGRRRADFDVAVVNRANAPVLVALEGADPDGELSFGFNRPPHELPAGHTMQTRMRVRPPKQIWLGRPAEHRLQVVTHTGHEAAERLARAPLTAEEIAARSATEHPPGGWRRRAVRGPRAFAPQVRPPGAHIGPGGVSFRPPQLVGPAMQAPQLGGFGVDLSSLRAASGGAAAPPAPSAPVMPSQAIFRQKAWLPWWLVPVGLTLAALAVVLAMLRPDNVTVPDLSGAKSAFEAEERLVAAGLALKAGPEEVPTERDRPGTVLDQTPKAGETAERDSAVAIRVAVGSGQSSVPDLTGLTLLAADKELREAGLSLGQASPQPPDPEGKISTHIPGPKEPVKEGTPVSVFFRDPDGEKADGGRGGGTGGGGGGGEDGADEGKDDGAGTEVVVPAIGDLTTEAYAKAAADEGLVPQTEKRYDASPPGTLFATEPAGGVKRNAGDKVTLLVSAGFPKLALDNDKDVLLVDGSTGKALDPIAEGSQDERDPAFGADGRRVAYQSAGRVFVVDLEEPAETPAALTAEGDDFQDLAWAPSTGRDVLAMIKREGDATRLCLGRVTAERIRPRCAEPPPDGITLGRKINWAPDGRSLLVFGTSKDTSVFGMVRYRSRTPFSADGSKWRTGGYVTDVSKPGRGVIDAALSPDGKTLAVVGNLKTRDFRLYTAKPDDLLLTKATPLGVRACKVVWRPDGKEVVVVQADACSAAPTGELLRLPVDDPKQQQQLRLEGDNPTFQPLTIGG